MTIDRQTHARLHLDMDNQLHARFIKVVPHGFRSTVLRTLISQLTDAVERDGFQIVASIIDNKVDLFTRRD